MREEIERRACKLEKLVDVVKKRKFKYFGHTIRANPSLANDIMTGMIEGTRPRGRPKRKWVDDITEWSGCSIIEIQRRAENRQQWRSDIHKWVRQRPYVRLRR